MLYQYVSSKIRIMDLHNLLRNTVFTLFLSLYLYFSTSLKDILPDVIVQCPVPGSRALEPWQRCLEALSRRSALCSFYHLLCICICNCMCAITLVFVFVFEFVFWAHRRCVIVIVSYPARWYFPFILGPLHWSSILYSYISNIQRTQKYTILHIILY